MHDEFEAKQRHSPANQNNVTAKQTKTMSQPSKPKQCHSPANQNNVTAQQTKTMSQPSNGPAVGNDSRCEGEEPSASSVMGKREEHLGKEDQ